MANAREIVGRYLGAAQKYPSNRAEIFRDAAYTFIGMAQDPKNARACAKLGKIAVGFANEASRERPPTMNDFNDLLRETHDAFHEVGDNPPNEEADLIGGDDPMDLIARRSEIQAARTIVHPGQISIAPETFDDKATLGRSAIITYQPTNDQILQGIVQRQTVAFWQGKKKEAQAMTVDVSLGFLPAVIQENDGTPFADQNNRPYAEIEYGSDGNRNAFQVDLALGRRLTVVGNYVSVNIGMDPPYQPATPPFVFTTMPITVGASIGAFAAPSLAPLIRTIYIDNFTALSGTPYIPIPLRATQMLPLQTNAQNGNSIELSFFDIGGNQISRFTFVQGSNIPQVVIPIFGDAAYVSITNAVVTGPVNIRLPFQLSL